MTAAELTDFEAQLKHLEENTGVVNKDAHVMHEFDLQQRVYLVMVAIGLMMYILGVLI